MSLTTTPPGVVDYNTPDTPTTVAPGHTTPAALTTTPAPRLIPNAFVELLTGGQALNARNVAAADAGAVFQGTVAGVLNNYQVTAGTDAQSSPTIIHPANYDAGTNAFVFTHLA